MTKIIPSHRRPRLVRRAALNLALAVFAALLLMVGTRQAHAQSPDVDPPGRVARLSDVNGQVWLYGPDSNEWIGAARNRPLTTGDRIATDNGARAEIALGSTTLRLDAGTELEVLQLDDARFVVRLASGSVAARLRSPQAVNEFELDTDEGRFRAQSVGRYRFDRFEQASDLTVFAGQATFEGRNSALPVTAGQHGQFWLDASGAAQYTMVQPVRDAFAGWNDERDRAEDRVAAVRFVSPEMTGAEDLDRYGRWEQTPEYGAIWTPSAVPSGWAPYSTGHWAWVRPWGWTWVDDAAWGFAPFHYGRWVYLRNSWGWSPGTYTARPVYAPALVAWMGGPRVSVSINIGGGPPVGWFPLAPREVYVPSYRTSPTYVRNVNITNVTNVTNITTIINNRNGEADRRDYANRRFPNAVTVVPASVLTGRQPVGPSAAQFRDNPQVRAFVSDSRPTPAFSGAPVAAPPVVARGNDGRPAPRPPFEGRTPGGFAGRGQGDRGQPDRGQADRGIPDRSAGDRSLNGRGGERPAGAAAPIAGVAPQGAQPAAPAAVNVRPGTAPDAAAVGRPPRGGIGREPMATDTAPPQRVVPPSPVQRGNAGAAGAIGANGNDGAARPGGVIQPVRPMVDPRAGEARVTPPPRIEPMQPVAPAITRVAPEPPRAQEVARPPQPMRSVEGQRLAVPPALQQRQEQQRQEQRAAEPPRGAAPARAPAPAEARPAPAEPAVRQEPQRPREEPRRDERRDDRKDK